MLSHPATVSLKVFNSEYCAAFSGCLEMGLTVASTTSKEPKALCVMKNMLFNKMDQRRLKVIKVVEFLVKFINQILIIFICE